METKTAGKWMEGGANLRLLRQRKGFSHDRLAAAVGTSRQHLIKLEKGWHRPSEDLLGRLAAALNVDASEIDEARREQQDAEDDEEESDVAVLLARLIRHPSVLRALDGAVA